MRFMAMRPFLGRPSSFMMLACACEYPLCLNRDEFILVVSLIRLLVMLVFKSREMFKPHTGLLFSRL